ncbi:MAG TPA: DUF1440 domain-containing protein [Pyrinomonadaceae bacterium]|nr:DUF1440 domain-containing protein [Pyrinomonadaceae bacterium]
MRHCIQACTSDKVNVLKGVTAGLVGGLVASWVMEEFQAAWSKVSENLAGSQETNTPGTAGDQSKRSQHTRVHSSSPEQQQGDGAQGGAAEQEPATVKAAQAISEGLFGHKMTKHEKKIAGDAVHYAFGTAVGGLYGGLAEVEPKVSTGLGLPFGTVFWLVADETAVPLLGLSKAPSEYPLSTHVYALASHLVYGVTADIVRRGVRSVL